MKYLVYFNYLTEKSNIKTKNHNDQLETEQVIFRVFFVKVNSLHSPKFSEAWQNLDHNRTYQVCNNAPFSSNLMAERLNVNEFVNNLNATTKTKTKQFCASSRLYVCTVCAKTLYPTRFAGSLSANHTLITISIPGYPCRLYRWS